MKISIIAVASALALAACGADDHEDLDGVVWNATTPPGARAEIDEQGTLTLAMGGPDFCPAPPCEPVALVTELPAGDFQLRFEGVSLENIGELGAHVTVGEYYVNTRFNRSGDAQGVHIDVLGESQYTTVGYSSEGHDPIATEFTLIRAGGRLTGWAKVATTEVTELADVGAGPGELTLYLEPEEDASPTSTSLSRHREVAVWDGDRAVVDLAGRDFVAAIARRAVSSEVTSFAADVIEPQ